MQQKISRHAFDQIPIEEIEKRVFDKIISDPELFERLLTESDSWKHMSIKVNEIINELLAKLSEMNDHSCGCKNQAKTPTMDIIVEEPIICSHCGTESPTNNENCIGCGKKLEQYPDFDQKPTLVEDCNQRIREYSLKNDGVNPQALLDILSFIEISDAHWTDKVNSIELILKKIKDDNSVIANKIRKKATNIANKARQDS